MKYGKLIPILLLLTSCQGGQTPEGKQTSLGTLYDMTCARVEHGMYRCWNKEVICYTLYSNGVSCLPNKNSGKD